MNGSNRIPILIVLSVCSFLSVYGEVFAKTNIMHFEENQGQAAKDWRFLVSASNYSAAIGSEAILFNLRNYNDLPANHDKEDYNTPERDAQQSYVLVKLLGANKKALLIGEQITPTRIHRFGGSKEKAWNRNIKTFAEIRAKDTYPGIDIIYKNTSAGLRFDFYIEPGAHPDDIQMQFNGSDDIGLDTQGNLVFRVGNRSVIQQAPIIYQHSPAGRSVIEGKYTLNSKNQVGFEIADYDKSRVLVIDPTIEYSTYLGGSDDDVISTVKSLADGSILFTGWTTSVDFPTADAIQAGLFTPSKRDAVLGRISSDGKSLDFATYFGGSSDDEGVFIDTNSSGEIIVFGNTGSNDFPILNAFDGTFAGGGFLGGAIFENGVDTFVAKLEPDGSAILFSTYLGGVDSTDPFRSRERARNLHVDQSTNKIYVIGETGSADFPVTSVLDDRTCLSDDSNDFGSNFSTDMFTSVLRNNGELESSACLGGSERDSGQGIAVLPSSGNIAVVGISRSQNMPITPGVLQPFKKGDELNYDGYIAILNSDLTDIIRASYIGGSGGDFSESVRVNDRGDLVVAGITSSIDFPMPLGGFQEVSGNAPIIPSIGPFADDLFILTIDQELSEIYNGTYFGGAQRDVSLSLELDELDRAYVAGWTESIDLPLKNSLQDTHGPVLSDELKLISSGPHTGNDMVVLPEPYSASLITRKFIPAIAVARGGALGGATNLLMVTNDDGSSLVSELDTVSSDTRVIVSADAPFDINDDGVVDVITGNCGDVNRVYFGNSNRIFELAFEFSEANYCTKAMVTVNINNDIYADLVMHDGNSLRYFINSGSNQFTESFDFPSALVVTPTALVKNSQGDLLIGDYDGLDIMLSFGDTLGDYTITPISTDQLNTTHIITADADFDSDSDVWIGYDGHPVNYYKFDSNLQSYTGAIVVGRTDTISVLSMSRLELRSGGLNFVAWEKNSAGLVVRTCYCFINDDGTLTFLPEHSLVLGATEISASIHEGNSGISVFSLTSVGASLSEAKIGSNDAFAAVFSPDFARLVFSTYMGSKSSESNSWGLDVMAPGQFVFPLIASSGDLPLKKNEAFDNVFEGASEGYIISLNIEDVLDIDQDDIIDRVDNCLLDVNSMQIDTDSDGFGNLCDSDFNNDCIVNFLDIGLFANEIFGNNATFDVNEDGAVNFLDFNLVAENFQNTPGPSGIETICSQPQID